MQKGEDKSVFAFTWLDEPNACPGCPWQSKAFEVAERSGNRAPTKHVALREEEEWR